MKLDLGKFRKIGGDAKHTIMRHEDGHELRIAHTAVSPKIRGQLAALPSEKKEHLESNAEKPVEKFSKGGDIQDPTQEHLLPGDKEQNKIEKQVVGEARQNYADGDEVLPPASPDLIPPQQGLAGYTGPTGTGMPASTAPTDPSQGAPGVQGSTGPTGMQPGEDSAQGSAQPLAPAESGPQGPAMHPPEAAMPTPPPAALPVGSKDYQGPAQPGNTGQQAHGAVDDYVGNMAQGYKLEKKGIEQEAAAKSELGNKLADIAQKQTVEAANQLSKEQSAQAAAIQQNQQFVNDVKQGYIKPNNYMENMSTPQRVTTAIGIMLSGIGSGLSGQPNMAMKFLADQIERDVAAQEKNLAAGNNLLAHNLQFTKNQQDARALTRAMINEGYAHQIEQAAALNKSPAAEAAKNMALGHLAQQNAFILSSIGKGPPTGSQSVGQQMDEHLNILRIAAPERAKELEARYIPGVGVASVPIDTATRGQIAERKSLQDQVVNLRQWAQKHAGTLNPADIQYGQTLAKTVQDAYRRANGQGVFKESEAKFVNGIVDEDPTKFFNSWRVDPRYKALENSNQYQLNGLYNSLGIKPMSGVQSQGSSAPVRFTPKR